MSHLQHVSATEPNDHIPFRFWLTQTLIAQVLWARNHDTYYSHQSEYNTSAHSQKEQVLVNGENADICHYICHKGDRVSVPQAVQWYTGGCYTLLLKHLDSWNSSSELVIYSHWMFIKLQFQRSLSKFKNKVQKNKGVQERGGRSQTLNLYKEPLAKKSH